MTNDREPTPLLFGHPAGLFTLFFAEMWERFSYYGMRALLIFYMTKGFLGYGDSDAYAVYGAYTALVYMTPFFGGMLADRILGQRRAVVLGGILMALGHLTMTFEDKTMFFTALALLITGNGFFKPNISTLVGSLYPKGSPRRDGGFTIFYMGINLGAAISPLLCGYVGETYGWHYGFGLATVGMLAGLAVFVAPTFITQIIIFWSAAATAGSLFWFHPEGIFSTLVNCFIAVALLAAAGVSIVALGRGGLPAHVGQPPDPERLSRPLVAGLRTEYAVYLGAVVAIPVFALLVSGFSGFTSHGEPLQLASNELIKNLENSPNRIAPVVAMVVKEASKPAGLLLFVAGLGSLIYLTLETFRLDKVRRERMFVVLILTFFSLFFWAFFEQAGSSINNFTDRNVDRVFAERVVTADDVGKTIQLSPTQEQFGYSNGGSLFTLDTLTALRAEEGRLPNFQIDWVVTADNVGMKIADRGGEVPASTFQSVNAVFILLFGLILTALWSWLGARGFEPSTPLKFALGLIQLALGFGAFWYGAQTADSRGMVGVQWLILGYLLHTTGELCLSPVGLSMVTKLTPARLASTLMGTWFLATAFSQYLAGIISLFTSVSGEGADGNVIPPPSQTVHVYGNVFFQIAVAGLICGCVCLVLVPVIKRWQHEGVVVEDE
ncbi:MAG: peptide MFS transporter [Planctomycetota bacterium]